MQRDTPSFFPSTGDGVSSCIHTEMPLSFIVRHFVAMKLVVLGYRLMTCECGLGECWVSDGVLLISWKEAF